MTPSATQATAAQAGSRFAFLQPLRSLQVGQAASDVIDLFLRQVHARCDGTAITSGTATVSYRQLDLASNQLANALFANQASKGDVVAIFVSDPALKIVAALGCLKAGCVFASLDPAYPPGRLQSMLEQAGARRVIVDAACQGARPRLLEHDGLARIIVGEAPHAMSGMPSGSVAAAAYPDTPIPSRTRADDPCYVYFTSGSTGRPKAILGRTGGLAHFIQWEIEAFELGSQSRVSQLTGPSFDVWLRDVFAPLCAGGTICIPTEQQRTNASALARWIDSEGITLVHCVPSVFRQLLQGAHADAYPALQHVLLAGEPLMPALANRWIACFGRRARLVNLYGPTETTLAKLCYRLPAEPLDTPFVPIGLPIPGAQAAVLDESLEPCAPGDLGELYIRTPYRSLGYLGNREATAAAFVANPFADDPTDLLYRTGDLARQLEDGNFQFCGRRDSQVKFNGVRIELAEIEMRLVQSPQVSEAAVLVRELRPGEPRLIAWFVPADAAEVVSTTQLRGFLSRWLPDHMLPASYVALEAMPLTPNGKLDRAALPLPGSARPALASRYQPPASDHERELCAAFAAVIGIDRVGRDDNFFELGGDSLLALKLRSRLKGAEAMTMREIFANPTPARMAAAIDSGARPTIAQPEPGSASREMTPRTPLRPDIPGARLGRDPQGTPAWFIPHPDQPGKYLRLS